MTDWTYGARSVHQAGASTRISYTPVEVQASRRGKCPDCGKTRTRSRTFTATINPLNKDPETGLPRTVPQIRATLRAKAEAWVPDFTCNTHGDAL